MGAAIPPIYFDFSLNPDLVFAPQDAGIQTRSFFLKSTFFLKSRRRHGLVLGIPMESWDPQGLVLGIPMKSWDPQGLVLGIPMESWDPEGYSPVPGRGNLDSQFLFSNPVLFLKSRRRFPNFCSQFIFSILRFQFFF